MKIPVWDITVRLAHLTYIIGIAALWWTGENRIFSVHIPIAFCLAGIITYRVLWGLFGTTTARFVNFVPTPRKIIDYIRTIFSSRTPHVQHIGHNPLGALAVFAMLAIMTFQIITGLFTVDTDGMNSGFLSSNISFDAGREASDLHELGFNILVGLIGLHIAAIASYFFIKKQNLVRPMITGKMEAAPDALPPKQMKVKAGALTFCLIGAAAVTATLFYMQFG